MPNDDVQPTETTTPANGTPSEEPTQEQPSLPSAENIQTDTTPPEPAETPNQPPITNWGYTEPSGRDTDSGMTGAAMAPVTWTASEFIDHEKNNSWFIFLGIITAVIIAVVFILTRDYVVSVVLAVIAILFGVTAARKPRTLQYQIDNRGIQIGEKLYTYASFKSFAVIRETAFSSIQLLPLKRFMPPLSLYYPPDQEQTIADALGSYLPYKEQRRDSIDRLMQKIHF